MEMDDERDLQDEDFWNFEHSETQTPPKAPRAVVSVSFSREDYARIIEAARRSDKKISEYIRDAALASIEGRTAISKIQWSGNQTMLATSQLTSITSVRVERREDRNFIQEVVEDDQRPD